MSLKPSSRNKIPSESARQVPHSVLPIPVNIGGEGQYHSVITHNSFADSSGESWRNCRVGMATLHIPKGFGGFYFQGMGFTEYLPVPPNHAVSSVPTMPAHQALAGSVLIVAEQPIQFGRRYLIAPEQISFRAFHCISVIRPAYAHQNDGNRGK